MTVEDLKEIRPLRNKCGGCGVIGPKIHRVIKWEPKTHRWLCRTCMDGRPPKPEICQTSWCVREAQVWREDNSTWTCTASSARTCRGAPNGSAKSIDGSAVLVWTETHPSPVFAQRLCVKNNQQFGGRTIRPGFAIPASPCSRRVGCEDCRFEDSKDLRSFWPELSHQWLCEDRCPHPNEYPRKPDVCQTSCCRQDAQV